MAVAFKPDRSLLNVKFEGYKLSSKQLQCTSKTLKSRVLVAKAASDQLSYQHVCAFNMHNHLVSDPWDTSSVYCFNEDFSIQRGKLEESGNLSVHPVYFGKTAKAEGSLNASLVFLSKSVCVFSDGCGLLQFLGTGDRVGESLSPCHSTSSDVEWVLLKEIKDLDSDQRPFMVLAAEMGWTNNACVNLLAMELKDPAPSSSQKPHFALYRWYKVIFSQDLNTIASLSRERKESSLTVDVDVVCCFQSSTMSKYSAFTGREGSLFLISESTPVLVAGKQRESCDNEEKEGGEGEKKATEHLGFGYHVGGEGEGEENGEGKGKGEEKPAYSWTQSETDVTVTVRVPTDITKKDVVCVIEKQNLVVGLTDGITYLRDKLFAPVDLEASAWTIEDHTVEVSLEKAEGGVGWPWLLESGASLAEGEKQASSRAETAALPQEESTVQATLSPVEDCDETDEDETFFVIREKGFIAEKHSLGGHQLLFTAPSPVVSELPLFCIRHDIDALILQPQSDSGAWNHVGTFNAFGYVQASKRDRKFITCAPDLSFAALSDCSRHVFLYRQPEATKANEALQFVQTLSFGEVLGLKASLGGLVYILFAETLVALQCSA